MAELALFRFEDYPTPGKATVWMAQTSDGVSLRFARWRPTVKARKGTVLLVQGRAEFLERYSETIADLRRRGFYVIAFDWRGQGGSQRLLRGARKGHVANLRQFEADLDLAVTEMQAHCPGPHFALAHSMGAALCLDASRRGQLPVERLVGIAPMLGLTITRRPQAARRLASLLYWLGLGRAWVPGGGAVAISTRPFEGNRLSSDPLRYARNAALAQAAAELGIGDPTVSWVRTAFQLMTRLAEPTAPIEVRVPTLLVAAGQDLVVSTPMIERFAARLKTGHALILPTAKHEILMETDTIRDQFWAAFDAFVPGERVGEEASGEAAALEPSAAASSASSPRDRRQIQAPASPRRE